MTKLTGGCYCGALRFEVTEPLRQRGECMCRACQHVSGGGPNFFALLRAENFRYTSGTPTSFTRADLPNAVTREFCATCGTHVVTRRPGLDKLVLKIGGLDAPEAFEGPQFAVFMEEAQPYHVVAPGVAKFDTLPPSG